MDHKVSKDMISSGMIPSGEKTQADLGKTQYGSAPSPSKLMDAYKSMYGNKEEVINEMAGKGMGAAPAPKPSGGMAKRINKKIDPETIGADRPKPTPETTAADRPKPTVTPKTFDSMKSQISDKDAKRERLKKIMADNESVDLLAAYHAVYEHHKKDADGNTIPHEDEEVNEGKIPAGLQAYLDKKKGKKEDKKEVKEMIERIAGGPPRNAMGKVITKSPAKAFGDLLPKNKSKGTYSFDKDSLEMKNKLDNRKAEVAKRKDEKKTEVGKIKDERREKVTNIVNKMGESADLFDVISTYFIEEGYDKKDVYAVMSSVDLTEEVQDLHEFIPAIMAGLKAVGGAIAKSKLGTMAGKALTKGKMMMSKIKPSGPSGIKPTSSVPSGTAKVTSSGGKTVQGGGPTSLFGKAKDLVKKNPMTSYMVARDMTSGGGGAGQTRTSSISASADLFDIVKGQLLDEGMSEEEIKDIMLTLTPDEIMKEIEESSMSGGSAGGAYQDLGPEGGFRSREQINRMHNDPKGTEKYGKKLMKRVGQAVRDTGTPTVRKVDESKK